MFDVSFSHSKLLLATLSLPSNNHWFVRSRATAEVIDSGNLFPLTWYSQVMDKTAKIRLWDVKKEEWVRSFFTWGSRKETQ